jgi:hypothetical protein
MVRLGVWLRHLSIIANILVREVMEYSSMAAPIYASWGIDTNIYYEKIKYNWKLKAIDSIMTMMYADKKELSLEECQKIIDNLIDNKEIKDMLVSNRIGITQ